MDRFTPDFPPFLYPNFEEEGGHIASGLYACASVHHACRILGTMHDTDLKFHIWINHQKIADTYFSCPSFLPFWSYALLKNCNEIFSARYLK